MSQEINAYSIAVNVIQNVIRDIAMVVRLPETNLVLSYRIYIQSKKSYPPSIVALALSLIRP